MAKSSDCSHKRLNSEVAEAEGGIALNSPDSGSSGICRRVTALSRELPHPLANFVRRVGHGARTRLRPIPTAYRMPARLQWRAFSFRDNAFSVN